MMLFNRFSLDIAMYMIPKQTKALGRRLSLPGSVKAEATAQAFEKACENRDVEQINNMIEDAICKYLGTTDIITALTKYCSKFGINVDLTNKSNLNRLREISKYRDKIRARLIQERL